MTLTSAVELRLAGLLAAMAPADIVYVDDDAAPGGNGTAEHAFAVPAGRVDRRIRWKC